MIIVALVAGIVLAIIWVPVIVGTIGRKVGNLYDGGDQEVEPTPFYSIFNSLRGKGKYHEALAEVRKQLDRFPNDFEGQMLLATLQAENLNDLPGAELTIHRFCEQPGHAPLNISYSLNLLADFQLKLAKDREAARAALQKVIDLLPDTEMSLQAAQRIGRLADTGMLLAAEDRQRVVVAKGVDNIGLLRESASLQPQTADPAALAAEYVNHLVTHPDDAHIRELLAVLYANHYQRLDLAADQLWQLARQPNQPAKLVVKWLNLLADLQVQHNAPPEQIRATLQAIVDKYPEVASAANARRRLDILKLEIKARQQEPDPVPMGAYEQNIGLKKRRT